MAAIYKVNGLKKGDRVLIYMPMIAEALFCNAGMRAHWRYPLCRIRWLCIALHLVLMMPNQN